MSALIVVTQQRFTAVLQATTALFRTLTMVRLRNSRTEEFTMLLTQDLTEQAEQLTMLIVIAANLRKVHLL